VPFLLLYAQLPQLPVFLKHEKHHLACNSAILGIQFPDAWQWKKWLRFTNATHLLQSTLSFLDTYWISTASTSGKGALGLKILPVGGFSSIEI